MKSYANQLEVVQLAIFEVISKGEEVEIEFMGTKKKYKRSNITELVEYESFLKSMIGREARGGLSYLRADHR